MAELRASNSFIETTFDSFAGSFESKLARLRYRAPALVAAILEDYGLEGPRLEVLDAGCGTGLYGIIVSPFARRHGAALLDEMSKAMTARSEEHTSELQSHSDLVCRLLLEKKKKKTCTYNTYLKTQHDLIHSFLWC